MSWGSSGSSTFGLDAALPPVIELESKIGEFGRGERVATTISIGCGCEEAAGDDES